MQTPGEIKKLLTDHGLSPRHAFGQNFLIDQNMVRKLVDASGVGPGSLVLEVGPGTGVLTGELLACGCRVVAGEIDRGMCGILRERFAGEAGRFRLIEGDCLAGKRAIAPELLNALGDGAFTLVANLPYGVATPLMIVLMGGVPRCSGLFVTIQKEVGDRLLASPGSKDYGMLTVLARCVADVELVATLPPSCFWPQPEVTSVMIAIRRRDRACTDRPGEFAEFCRKLFEKRRKQLGAVLGRSFPFPPGVDPRCRAETLGVDELLAVWKAAAPEQV